MKTANIFNLKSLKSKCAFLFAAFALFMFISCSNKDASKPPDDSQIPVLTDPIPYDRLGSGTIVFKRFGTDSGPFGGYQGCYVIDVDQQKTWAIDFSLFSSSYCISPDGNKIVLSMYTGLESAYDIYSINIDGTNLKQLNAVGDQDFDPSWSQDGNTIFFLNLARGSLWSQSPVPNATDLRKITGNFLPWGAVSVSPTGKIAYVNFQGLYTMNIDGYNRALIVPFPEDSNNESNFESPVFSPDGQKIAFLNVIKDSLNYYQEIDIMEVDAEGGSPVLIAGLTASGRQNYGLCGTKRNCVNLARSPDGSKFLVTIPEGDLLSHIYLLNADGSHIIQITSAEGVTDRFVSWGR